ncbi:MAG TPA: enoyl-CoA hydratase [Rhizomicrobium sp.]|nr:enoyl-CoA hydratase [Rhizomicrobium sp.]
MGGAYEDIIYDVKERIATITLNRPDRLNAYTDRMALHIRTAMAEAAHDPHVRAIVLTGAGRGFCAGADMDVLTNIIGGARDNASHAHDVGDAFHSQHGPSLNSEFADMRRFAYFMRTKKPIIAAINGPVAGIGLVMALYADMRFVSDKAALTTSFAQRGLIAEHGISWLLPRLVGPAHALDLLLSARKVTPAEAERMGLVNKVLPQETFMADVMTYARLLADTVSPRSMAIIKAQVWKAEFQTFGEALAVADIEMAQTFKTPDFKEGVAHYLEKRAAQFADI